MYVYIDIYIYIAVNLKTLLKTKKELKIIKVTFISKPDGICGELKGFARIDFY